MKSNRTIATLSIIVALFICLIPSYATANTSAINQSQIQEAIDSYSHDIAQSYTNAQLGVNPSTRQEEIAKQNGYDTLNYLDDGFSLISVDVTNQLLSVDSAENTYTVHANITTDILLKPIGETTVVIGGEQQESLDTSMTDEHVITLVPKQINKLVTLEVIKDQIVDPASEDNQPPFMTQAPLSQPNNVLRNNRSKRSTASDMFTNKAGLNYLKAIAYAQEWTDPAHKDSMNPDFPVFGENNCTNFVSQALYAGGLPTTYGTSIDIWNKAKWTWNLAGIAGATHTWSGADNNYHYMKDYSGAFTVENDPWKVGEGGLIYADWEGDGNINHAMIVVGYVKGPQPTPIICQKSRNRHNYEFYKTVASALEANNNVVWYGLQWKPDWV